MTKKSILTRLALVLGLVLAVPYFFVSPSQVLAAAACPITDGGAGDADNTVNGTILIGTNTTWTAEAGEQGVIDCSSLNITVDNGITLTLDPYDSGDTNYENDYGVTLQVQDLLVEGNISADGLGYSNGNGPGQGVDGCGSGGGAYGGEGGTAATPYGADMVTHPTMLGSSGGVCNGNSAAGGGAIIIQASGTTTVNGSISANGQNGDSPSGYGYGGGSGGSIYITTDGLAGTGSISVNGGPTTADTWYPATAGAGGRMAVISNTDTSSITYTAKSSGGLSSGGGRRDAGAGTIFTKSGSNNGDLFIDTGLSSLSDEQTTLFKTTVSEPMTLDNINVTRFSYLEQSGEITVTNNVSINEDSHYQNLSNLYIGNELSIKTDAYFTNESSAHTEYASVDYAGGKIVENGGYMTVLSDQGDLTVPNSSTLELNTPRNFENVTVEGTLSHSGNVDTKENYLNLTIAGNMSIATGGEINVIGKGLSQGLGEGAGASATYGAGGGGYGGAGGGGESGSAGGSTKGLAATPTLLGSSGGKNSAGYYAAGGGAIQLDIAGTLLVNGTINANGQDGGTPGGYGYGPGSGGAIYVLANALEGTGSISANGGYADPGAWYAAGGGGGGRIALYLSEDNSNLTALTVDGGIGYHNGGDGSIYTQGKPSTPSNLAQYQSDGTTSISQGAEAEDSTVVIKFRMMHGESTATLTPQVEIKEVGDPFENIATNTGDDAAFTGTPITAAITVGSLSENVGYHWQARVCDENNFCSQWANFGSNNESAADFTVVTNNSPNNPVIPGSSTFINAQYSNDTTPTFLFSQSDADTTDQVKYQIQIDNNNDFSSPEVNYVSALSTQGTASFTVGQTAGSGTYNSGNESQTLGESGYYWRIKTIDQANAESSWVTAAGAPAFTIDTTSPTNDITTSMKRNQAATTEFTDDSSAIWFNQPSPYFSWTTSGDTSGLRGYCIYLGTDVDGDPSAQKGILGTSPASTTGSNCQFIVEDTNIDFANSSLRGNTWLTSSDQPYYFKIRPLDTANNAGQSDSDSATFKFYYDSTAPGNVSNISVSSGSVSSISDMNFYWPTSGLQAASDGESGILGYQYALNSTATWRGVTHDDTTGFDYIPPAYAQPFSLDASTVGDDIIIGNNILFFRTIDVAGNTSNYTTATLEYGGESPAFADSDSVTITPNSNTENSFSLNWPAATPSDGRTITSYYYMINTAPPSSYSTITSNSATYIPTTQTSVETGSLTNVRKGANTVYVVAVDDNGNYSQSNYISGTFTLDSDLPDPPQSLVVSDSSIKSASLWRASLAWAEPDYKGTGDLTYTIQRSNDAETWSEIATTTGLAYLDTLASSQEYFWRVASTDSSDESIASPSYSNAESLTPKGSYTEPAELTSGPATSSITTKRATVSWTTARKADSKVAIGTGSGDYETVEPSDSTQTTEHSLSLANLQPGTTYYYVAKWTDEDGNTGESEEKTFQTSPPPTVKDVVVKNIGIDSALIEFTTLGATSAKVNFGPSTSFGGVETISTSTLETTYTVQLSDLEDGTKYYYKIDTLDAEEDTYEGTILNFETLPRPEISNVQVQQVANSAQSSIQVSWESNTEISSIITFYPESNPEYARDAVDINLVEGEHQMVVPGLLPETSYILIVKGRDRIGNEAISDSFRFTTATDTRPPLISDLVIEGTNTPQVDASAQQSNAQLVVTWTTDEPATSQVEFGDGTGSTYSQTTQEDQTLTYNHLVIISGLTPSKVYHLRAISKDSAGNYSRSVDTVTITPKAIDNAFDLVITNLRQAFGFLAP